MTEKIFLIRPACRNPTKPSFPPPCGNNVVFRSKFRHADPSTTMEQHFLQSLKTLRSILRRNLQPSTAAVPAYLQQQGGHHYGLICVQSRTFKAATWLWAEDRAASSEDSSHRQRDSQDAIAADALAQGKGKQIRTPWHRDDATLPPVARQELAGAMKKGAGFFAFSIKHHSFYSREGTYYAFAFIEAYYSPCNARAECR